MKVTGDKAVAEALRMMGRGVPAAIINKAMKDAAAPMHADAVATARLHRQPGRRPAKGHLDENIAFKQVKTKGKSRKTTSFAIGGVGRGRQLLHLLEFGTKPHWQPRRQSLHPGARRFPIMRPSYEAHSETVPRQFGIAMWRQLQMYFLGLSRGKR